MICFFRLSEVSRLATADRGRGLTSAPDRAASPVGLRIHVGPNFGEVVMVFTVAVLRCV